MTGGRRWMWIALLLLVSVGLDQATKVVAIRHLSQEITVVNGTQRVANKVIAFPESWKPNDLFRFQYAENTGAFLSLFSNLPNAVRSGILIGLNSVILLLVTGMLFIRRDMAFSVAMALSLILSGGVGNLIDRIFRDGRVVDFMNVGIGWNDIRLRSGIFNIADMAIMAGLFWLIGIEIYRMLHAKEEEEGEEAEVA